MATKPVLYVAPISVNCFGPWLLLKEIGIEFETVFVDLTKGEHKKPDFLAVNPLGQIPALKDGTHGLFEGNSIMRYVCAKFLGYAQMAKFYNPDPLIRAKIEIALDWRQSAWYPNVAKATYTKLFGADPEKFNPIDGVNGVDSQVSALEYFLGGNDFIGGTEPCIADFAIVPTFQFLRVSTWQFPKVLLDYEERFSKKVPTYEALLNIALKGFIAAKIQEEVIDYPKGTLYASPVSINSLGALLLLSKGAIDQIEVSFVDPSKKDQKYQDLLAINPTGTLPTLKHGALTIWDTASVLRYLSSKFKSAAHYYPADPDLRATIDTVLEWRQTSWIPHVLSLINNPEKFTEASTALNEAVPVLQSFLSKPFLAGSKLSIADMAVMPSLRLLGASQWKVPTFLQDYEMRVAQELKFEDIAVPFSQLLKSKLDARPPKLYHFPLSPNSLPVWLLLKESGIVFSSEVIDLSRGDQKKPAFLSLNPQGQVPVFVHDKAIISESGAILRYIASAFPQARKYYTEDVKVRALINQALDWRQTEWMPLVIKVIGEIFGMQISKVVKDEATEQLISKISILEWLLGGRPFIGGEVPSIADISFFPTLVYLPHANFQLTVSISGYLNRLNSYFSTWSDISSSGLNQLLERTVPKLLKPKAILYYAPLSVNALGVYSFLKEIEVPFESKVLDLSKGENKTPQYLSLNPNGQLPTLVDSDGTVVFESNAILRYLAEKYSKGSTYYPKNPEIRSHIDYILDWRQTSWYPNVARASYSTLFGFSTTKYNPEEGLRGLQSNVVVLEGLLVDKEYVAGDDPTIADFAIAPTLHFVKVTPFKLPSSVKSYSNRFQALPSWKESEELALKNYLKKLTDGALSELEDITNKVFEADSPNKLIVVGGGFAGAKIAMASVISKQKLQVLMIDTKDYWEFTPMVHRTLIQPERAEQYIIHHDRNLKGKWYRGQVTEVTKDHVVVDDLYIIRYNYLVIASGSRYPSVSGGNISKDVKKITKAEKKATGNMKDQYSDAQNRLKVIEAEALRIKNAKHIVIIGGGPVGIELAAEICTKYPTKRLTLISSQQTFMADMKNPTVHKKVAAFFHSYGVILRFGEKVVSVNESYGKYTVSTDAEINKKIEADKVYFCAGMIPNTEFVRKNFAACLTDGGLIKVTETLVVENQTNIWAIGDCNNTHELKTAYVAMTQADYFLKNLSKFIKQKKVPAYTPMTVPPPLYILSLGPFRGAMLAGSKILSTHKLAVAAKSGIASSTLTAMNQDKSLLKTDWDKLLTKDLKENKGAAGDADSDDEQSLKEAKNLGLQFDFH